MSFVISPCRGNCPIARLKQTFHDSPIWDTLKGGWVRLRLRRPGRRLGSSSNSNRGEGASEPGRFQLHCANSTSAVIVAYRYPHLSRPETSNRQNSKRPSKEVRGFCRVELAQHRQLPVGTYGTMNPNRRPEFYDLVLGSPLHDLGGTPNVQVTNKLS